MTGTESETNRHYTQVLQARQQAAHALYEAELALHDAHRSQVDQWIKAASDRLHIAVVRHLEADALVRQLELVTAA